MVLNYALEIWLSSSNFHPRKLRHRGGDFPKVTYLLGGVDGTQSPGWLLIRCRVVLFSTPRFTPYPPILATSSLKWPLPTPLKTATRHAQTKWSPCSVESYLGGKGWLSLGPGFFLTFDASNCKGKTARQMTISPAPSMPHCSRTHW